jgi:hypothetical protein
MYAQASLAEVFCAHELVSFQGNAGEQGDSGVHGDMSEVTMSKLVRDPWLRGSLRHATSVNITS